LVVLLLQRDHRLAGTGLSLALATLPGLIGMNVALGGWMNTAMSLALEREDGTLLGAKATPNGMIGYLTAKITLSFLNTAFGLVVFIVAGLLLLPDLRAVQIGDWLLLIGVFVLSMLACLPWGAIMGSVVETAGAGFGPTFLPMSVLVRISGIFYPITALAGWLQAIAQAFPVYWLGLGMRHALMPDAAVAAEIGQSWRTAETFGVLTLWALVGLLVAPRMLRGMARREAGSVVEARRQHAKWTGV
jgi:ABC-2 type transport system permease protein